MDSPSDSRLLAALPRDVLARLRPDLELFTSAFKEVLYEEEKPITHVYFPLRCVASLLTRMENGDAVEVGTVGNEGFVGLPVLLGASASPMSALAFAQIPGEALRMAIEPFRAAIRREPPFLDLLLRYTSAFFMQVAQSAACNRLYTIDERCCRWLLMSHDRVGSDHMALTQEFLSQMLGVRRASVNAVATLLQRNGLIRYTRGRITVLDRQGLEKGSCECYRVIRREFDRVLGPGVEARPPRARRLQTEERDESEAAASPPPGGRAPRARTPRRAEPVKRRDPGTG